MSSMRMRRALRGQKAEEKPDSARTFHGITREEVDGAIEIMRAALGGLNVKTKNTSQHDAHMWLNMIVTYFREEEQQQDMGPGQVNTRMTMLEDQYVRRIKDIRSDVLDHLREHIEPTVQMQQLDEMYEETRATVRSPETIRIIRRIRNAQRWIERQLEREGLRPVEAELEDEGEPAEAPRMYGVLIDGRRHILRGVSAEIAEELVIASTCYQSALREGLQQSAATYLENFHAAHQRFPDIPSRAERDVLATIWSDHFERMLKTRLEQHATTRRITRTRR